MGSNVHEVLSDVYKLACGPW